MRADVIVDMQFGSTGKGAVAAWLVGPAQTLGMYEKYDSSVRVQSIQAGHTVWYKGKPYKMRTIPCAWVNPDVQLYLGPGCFIDRALLLSEIKMIWDATGTDPRDRLVVDRRAFFIEDEDIREEEHRNLEGSMGSTAHGAGASLIRKLWRKGDGRVCASSWTEDNGIRTGDVIRAMQKQRVLVEGCQGAMLSIHTSPYYPYVTTRESTAAGIMSEAGLAPRDINKVFGVFRTFPIRVGGNSGDTGGEEMSWEEINRNCGRIVEPERTTVTNRVRRVFNFSDSDFMRALWVNKPDRLFMTFADYLAPEIYGKCRMEDIPFASRATLNNFTNHVNELAAEYCKIQWIGTGEQAHHYILP